MPDTIVYIVDDDEDARDSVAALVEAMGLRARTFASAVDFLACYDDEQPGCLVADVRMPVMSGFELQKHLKREHKQIPIILISGYARVPGAVAAMREGAITVLEKPYRDQELWDAIQEAVRLDQQRREAAARQKMLRDRFASLSEDERLVLDLIVLGHANKVVAIRLGISQRTVEDRRRRIMTKTGADSFAELIKLHEEARHAGPA